MKLMSGEKRNLQSNIREESTFQGILGSSVAVKICCFHALSARTILINFLDVSDTANIDVRSDIALLRLRRNYYCVWSRKKHFI